VSYQSLADLFLSQVKRYGDRVLYRFARQNEWTTCSWNEAARRVREIGLGLVSLGIKKGDRVAIFSVNGVEWSLVDWANICVGALTVPIYASSTASQVSHILEHSGASVLFAESPERLAKLNLSAPALRHIKKFISFCPRGEADLLGAGDGRMMSLGQLQELGRRYSADHGDPFEALARSLRPEDDLTIIYTSGTTGEPKGVLTTHDHYLFVMRAVDSALPSSDQDINHQFLPFAHSLGRMEHYMVVAKGYTCGFARSMETIAKDLLTIRPTLLFSVPRIYENGYSRIRSRVAAGGSWEKLAFRLGTSIGRRITRVRMKDQKISPGLKAAHSLADRLIFSKIRESFGGRLRMAISGGAPLSREIAEFFHSLGILILEGYGLTETATVSHVNRSDRYKFGTVGLSLDGVESRIAPDGEILLRGPNILKGYYKNPVGTRTAIDPEGWFYTGDIGEIDREGFLRITDRKKDLIVTSGGKKIPPQVIENLLKGDPLISQAIVVGDRQKHLLALVTLNRELVEEWGRREGVEFGRTEEITGHPRVLALVQERIRQKNKELAPFEAVRGFRILPHDLTVEKEELTPTLKLRRQVIVERYKDLIDEMSGKSRFEL
jgi:long-chain acyl-CoA synthetase